MVEVNNQRQLGRYRIDAPIAKGGMGSVHRATDLELHRAVAIKLIAPHHLDSDQVRKRFMSEARSLARLNNPHVVQIYDIDVEGEQPFLVMEYVEGKDCSQLIKDRGAFSVRKAIDCAMQTLAGLIGAHRAGLVHRDIKPGNILRSNSGMYKLADFGLAQGSDLPEDITQENIMVGTLRFAAPEVARGDMATPATDLFSFGITFFELLSGQRARREKQSVALLKEVATEEVRDIADCLPGLNQKLCKWWRSLTAFDPHKRFVDAQQAYEALVQVAEGLFEDELEDQRSHKGTDVDRDASTAATQTAYNATMPVSSIAADIKAAVEEDETQPTAKHDVPTTTTAVTEIKPPPSPPVSQKKPSSAQTTDRISKTRVSFMLKLLLAIWLVSSAASFAVAWMVTTHALSVQHERWREQLKGTALAASLAIDGDAISSILREGDMTSFEWLELYETLRRFGRADPGIIDIYTMAETDYTQNDGIVQYVVDGREEWDRNNNGMIDVGERRAKIFERLNASEQAPRLLDGFYAPVADDEIRDGLRGLRLSGYAPIYGSSGKVVGVVGVDASGQHLVDLQSRFMTNTIIFQLATLIAFLAAATIVAGRFNRPLAMMQRAMKQISNGDLTVSVDVKSHDEFAELAVSVNQMVAGLRERDELRTAFERYLTQDISESLTDGQTGSVLLQYSTTWVYCDLASITEDSVMNTLEPLLGRIIRTASQHGGAPERVAARGLLLAFPVVHDGFMPIEQAMRASIAIAQAAREDGVEMAIGLDHVDRAQAGDSLVNELLAGADRAVALGEQARRIGETILCRQMIYNTVRFQFSCERLQLEGFTAEKHAIQHVVSVAGVAS